MSFKYKTQLVQKFEERKNVYESFVNLNESEQKIKDYCQVEDFPSQVMEENYLDQ